jgi:hypothetical protein
MPKTDDVSSRAAGKLEKGQSEKPKRGSNQPLEKSAKGLNPPLGKSAKGLSPPLETSEKGPNRALETDRSDRQGKVPVEADRPAETNRPLVGKPGRRLAANRAEKQQDKSEHSTIDKPESKGRIENLGSNRSADRSDEKQQPKRPVEKLERRRSKDKTESIGSTDRHEPSRPVGKAGRRSADKEKQSEEKRSANISEKRSHGSSQSTCAVVSRHLKGAESEGVPSEETPLPVYELGGPAKNEEIQNILKRALQEETEKLKVGIIRQEENIKFSSDEAGKMYSLLLDEHKDAFRYCNTFITEKCMKQSSADLKRWSENPLSNSQKGRDWQKGRAAYVERLKTILGQKNLVFDVWMFESLPLEWMEVKEVSLYSKAELEASKKRKSDTRLEGHGRNRKRDGRGSF